MRKPPILICVFFSAISIIGFYTLIRDPQSLRSDILIRLDELPASYRQVDPKNNAEVAILVLRVLPSEEVRRSAWDILKSNEITRRLELFDAADCHDFGDDQLLLLSESRTLEFLSLDRTAVTDRSIESMIRLWPRLQYVTLESCPVKVESIVRLLMEKKLSMIRISEKLNNEELRQRIHEVSPRTIVMCDGVDIMNQPEAVFEKIPWAKWN